jgi:L-ascorbate metabolism protein UlaG (beta-lactamase superfamily)
VTALSMTKFGHACIRVTDGETTVVVDPGMFTEPEALDGATAVLVTHDHGDHLAVDRVREALDRQAGLQIWCNDAVAAAVGGATARVHVVGNGDAFSVGGIGVTVHGEWHEVVHPDIPRAKNVGFLLGGAVFHPGDAFTLPGVPVAALLLPVHAPWSRIAGVIDYARAVAPGAAYAAHDSFLSEAGLAITDRLLSEGGPGIGTAYARLRPGQTVTV